MRILRVLVLLLFASCARGQAVTEPIVVEDQGGICFTAHDASAAITVSISTGEQACFSSSCTQVLETKGSLLIDRDRFTIYGTSYFVLQDISRPGFECTGDCGGAGGLTFEIDDLADGTYTVYMDDQPFGHVTLPLASSNFVCLDGPLTNADEIQPQAPGVATVSTQETSPLATATTIVESPIATPTSTATPIVLQPVETIPPTPTHTPQPNRIVIPSSPDCMIDGEQVTCTDNLLHMTFRYPLTWGSIEAFLRRGEAGYAYIYAFREPDTDGRTNAIAGGLSANFSEGRGGTELDFRGSSDLWLEEDCQLPNSRLCEEIKPGVLLTLYFPDDGTICDLYPWGFFYPRGSVYIDLPIPRLINGFVFHISILSEAQEEELYGLLGDFHEQADNQTAVGAMPDCSPEARDAFNLKRLVMFKQIEMGIMDANTASNIQALYELAESIEGPGLPQQ